METVNAQILAIYTCTLIPNRKLHKASCALQVLESAYIAIYTGFSYHNMPQNVFLAAHHKTEYEMKYSLQTIGASPLYYIYTNGRRYGYHLHSNNSHLARAHSYILAMQTYSRLAFEPEHTHSNSKIVNTARTRSLDASCCSCDQWVSTSVWPGIGVEFASLRLRIPSAEAFINYARLWGVILSVTRRRVSLDFRLLFSLALQDLDKLARSG